MKAVCIIAVGHIKTAHWREASMHYKKCLSHFLHLEEREAKDADARFSIEKRKEIETAGLLKLLHSGDVPICLDERGTSLDSLQFASLLGRLFEAGKRPSFIVGGAYGLAAVARTTAAHCISFGSMTLPHELARVILLEQLYRAANILVGTGYHH
jgi:23S rRNA (pseudouridine1915-N3)-methyltransferase